MNELTLFCNKLLEDNPKIVKQYIDNQVDVDCYKNNFDKEMLIALIDAFKEKIKTEELTPFIKTQIIQTVIAMILAIRDLQKETKINVFNIK